MASLDSNFQLPPITPDSGQSVKILVVGDSEVGKSSLVHLICHRAALSRPGYTTGCSLDVKIYEYFQDKTDTPSREQYFLEFWDVGGSAAYQKSRFLFYDSADGVILVHDLTNRKSHDNLRKWLKEIFIHRTKGSGKKGHKYTRSEDFIKGFDPEIYANSALPTIVVGTKKDISKLGNELISHSPLAAEINAQVTAVNCRNASNFTPGAPEMQCLNAFFDKVIHHKFYHSPVPTREDETLYPDSSLGSTFLRHITQSFNSSFSGHT